MSAFPRGFWSNEYYAPADGERRMRGGAATRTCRSTTPTPARITINWETTAGNGSFTLAANETGLLPGQDGRATCPTAPASTCRGTGTFWGISDIDTNSRNWDWGYSLVRATCCQTTRPSPGPRATAPLACDAADGRGNGLFLTPAHDNTTFFIDTNGDGTPDTDASIEVLRGATAVTATGSGYRANRLDSLYITGSNSGTSATSICDLTGARIYATGPFSMSYGENPDKTSAAGGLDLGYTVLPSPGNWMDLALTVDKATNPVLVSTVAGVTTVTYTLIVQSHLFNIDSVSVVDTLPANWAFDNNSTMITLPEPDHDQRGGRQSHGELPTLTWGSGPARQPAAQPADHDHVHGQDHRGLRERRHDPEQGAGRGHAHRGRGHADLQGHRLRLQHLHRRLAGHADDEDLVGPAATPVSPGDP